MSCRHKGGIDTKVAFFLFPAKHWGENSQTKKPSDLVSDGLSNNS